MKCGGWQEDMHTGHGHFSASAAPLISASSRELARKASVLRHTPGGGLCSLHRRKLSYRLCRMFLSFAAILFFSHWKRLVITHHLQEVRVFSTEVNWLLNTLSVILIYSFLTKDLEASIIIETYHYTRKVCYCTLTRFKSNARET